jgi:hypothetical protein
LLLEIQLSRGEGWDPLHLLRLPHFCACPKPGFGFLSVYVMVYFAFNDLIWEVQINLIFNDNVGYILIVFMLQYEKSPKQLPNCLKMAETSNVLIGFNGNICDTVSFCHSTRIRYQKCFIRFITK